MLAARDPSVAGALLLLSFPLHPPEKPEQMRTAHFPSLQTPALFVSGERDGFGTRDELEAALKTVPAPTKLMMVPGTGHELMAAKNRTTLPGDVVKAFLGFVKVP
jgi:predicted alpha/beta-hydrolase family hydrolase